MSYRRILVPLFGERSDRAALQLGIATAKQFGSHLDALFVGFDPLQSAPYSHLAGDVTGVGAKHLIEAAVRVTNEGQAAATTSFSAVMKASDVEVTGTPRGGPARN
jgi:hypothetical protein